MDDNPPEGIASLQKAAGLKVRDIWLSNEDIAKVKSSVYPTSQKKKNGQIILYKR